MRKIRTHGRRATDILDSTQILISVITYAERENGMEKAIRSPTLSGM
jgi:hypothetical protein